MKNAVQQLQSPFAPVQNMALMLQLANRLINRDPNLPGLGVFYGPSGFGKTVASIYCQNKTCAIRVEIGETWTKKKFFSAILKELGVAQIRGTISDLCDQ
ncbi:MAG: ATP-binding protein, partial [Cohaesibacteraceae bacterium]|nr:ATP-binding protein [Cohaesibacteraceae bacterium]